MSHISDKTFAELRARMLQAEREYNAGARIADNRRCPSCNARGWFGVCPRCAWSRP